MQQSSELIDQQKSLIKKMTGFDEGNNKHNSKWTLLTLACLSGAFWHLGIDVVGASSENTGVAKAHGSCARPLDVAKHLAEEEIMEEMLFEPVSNVFEETTVLHPQFHQLPSIDQRGPGDHTGFFIGVFSDVSSPPSAKQRCQLVCETCLGNGNDPCVCSLQDCADNMVSMETSECKTLHAFVV